MSSGICGAVLLMVGSLHWEVVRRMDEERVDRELRRLAAPHLERLVGPQHWRRFEDALAVVSGSGRSDFALMVRDELGESFRTRNWPVGLSINLLPVRPRPGLENRPVPPRRGEPISAANPALPISYSRFVTVRAGGTAWRVAVLGSPYTTVYLAGDVGRLTAGTRGLFQAALTLLPVALLLIGSAAWLIAARAVEPVAQLTAAAEQVTTGGLDRRLHIDGQFQEFQGLIGSFNRMLDRLEAGFDQANRFSADAAHELRTPLTVLQGEIELGLRSATPAEEGRWLKLLDQIVRLRVVVDRLLLLSQADAGALPLIKETLALDELVSEAVEDLRAAYPDLDVAVEIESGILVLGDRHLLGRVFENLTTNAGRHNSPTGTVRVNLARIGHSARFVVANTGPGIPDEQRERVFERFYRCDASRSRELGGAGLGLSLARGIVRAHGGELRLGAAANGWTQFDLWLPLVHVNAPSN